MQKVMRIDTHMYGDYNRAKIEKYGWEEIGQMTCRLYHRVLDTD